MDAAVPPSLLHALAARLGPRGFSVDPADLAAHGTDWRGLYRGRPACLLRPATTEECAAAVRLCAEAGVGIVPQGGNTSMVGGAVPDETGRQVVLSLARMNRIRALDPVDMTMVAEAGVVLKAAQDAAAAAGCLFPLSLGAEGSATIGGVLSTNAGGNTTIRYGNARDLMLGLEVVLADGSVIHGLRRLRKDNTGYALRHLFAGAEGRLASSPLPCCGCSHSRAARPRPSPQCPMRRRRSRCSAASARPMRARCALRIHVGRGVELVLRHIPGTALPLAARAEHYCLIDLATSRRAADLPALLEATLAEALEAGEVTDAAIASSAAQRAAMWRLREEHSEAQKREGASVKNDVSVPVSAVPELIRRAREALLALVPGSRPVAFGHIGDGNIHLNLLQPERMEAAAFLARAEEIMGEVNAIVRALDGSFSAEHGIGRLKPAMLAEWRGGAELAAMRAIKAALDPRGVMNPGKLLA